MRLRTYGTRVGIKLVNYKPPTDQIVSASQRRGQQQADNEPAREQRSDADRRASFATIRIAERSTVTFYNDGVVPLLRLVNPGELFTQFSTLFPGTVRPRMPHKARNLRFDYYIGLPDSYLSDLVVGLFVAESDCAGRALLGHEEAQLTSTIQVTRLANMCHAANTNYEFIHVEEELMACHFRRGIFSRRWKAGVQSMYCLRSSQRDWRSGFFACWLSQRSELEPTGCGKHAASC